MQYVTYTGRTTDHSQFLNAFSLGQGISNKVSRIEVACQALAILLTPYYRLILIVNGRNVMFSAVYRDLLQSIAAPDRQCRLHKVF